MSACKHEMPLLCLIESSMRVKRPHTLVSGAMTLLLSLFSVKALTITTGSQVRDSAHGEPCTDRGACHVVSPSPQPSFPRELLRDLSAVA